MADKGSTFLIEAAKLRDAQPHYLEDLQRVRHNEQRENNAWNVFNRVQEALIKGGYKQSEPAAYSYRDIVKGQLVPGRRVKEITSIKDKVRINTQLWKLASNIFLKDVD